MEKQTDYARLRPPEPALEEELCRCLDAPPIRLVHLLTANPMQCMNCNLEVSPEPLALPQRVVDDIARWNTLYGAIYCLWLDSEDYEDWAKEQLSDITSAVNTRGRDVQRELNPFRRCYFDFFQDQSVDEYLPPRFCPFCGDALQDYTSGIYLQRVCERDSLVVDGE